MIAGRLNRFYERIERLFYTSLVIIFLIVTALTIFSAVTKLVEFFLLPNTNIVYVTLEIADKLLLSLMFIEITHTIKAHLAEQKFLYCLEPFLLVAIIASIRRILIISLEISHAGELPKALSFNQYMIELAILGIMVVVFILSIVFIRKSGICDKA